MSETANPYQSPETIAAPLTPLAAQGSLTESMLMYLKKSSPWLRFIGILGYISAGFTVLLGISFFALGSIIGEAWASIPGFESFSGVNDAIGVASGLVMGLLTIGTAVIIFFPSLFTYRFGAKIRSYIRDGREQDLELAFKNNKSLWKFYGIIGIIYLAFIPLTVIITIIVAVASSLS